MCLLFVTAFLQYKISIGIAQYLSLSFFAVCGLLVLCGRRRTDRVQHILSGGGLWFAAVVFGEVVSYTSHDTYSEAYGILFIGVFFCARLVVQEIGIPNVLRAYSQAGFLTACVVLISGRHTMLARRRSVYRRHPRTPQPTLLYSGGLSSPLSSGGRWRRRNGGGSEH